MAAMAAAIIAPVRADDRQYLQMRNGMRKFAPLVGTWNAKWTFYDKDGSVTVLRGAYVISYVLDGAYLEWKGNHERKGRLPKTYAFIILTTFNPDSRQYEETYFYNNWPQRVVEIGIFDAKRREFRTHTLVPREDGIHDEHVRTILSIKGPNKMAYKHYSRYSNEVRERLNLVITLTRNS
jgi:Protein of unknown function (DUF1579)